MKYLGVTIDEKLSWKQEFTGLIKRAKCITIRLARAVGPHWGLRPRLLRWAFQGIVKPIVSYGVVVWGASLLKNQTLMHLNRLISLIIVPVRLNTPTQGMEMIYNLIPLDIYLKGEGVKSYLRTTKFDFVQWDGMSQTRSDIGHRAYWNKYVQESGYLNQPSDVMVNKLILDKNYDIDYDSFKDSSVVNRGRLELFTDG